MERENPLLDTPMSRRKFLQSIPVFFAIANAACQGNLEIPEATQQSNTLVTPESTFLALPKYQRKKLTDRIKGINFPSWSKGEYQSPTTLQSLKNALQLRPNMVGIIATWYQDTIYSTDIKPTINTPTDEDLQSIITYAHDHNLAVMLKTHIIVLNPNNWHGQIGINYSKDQSDIPSIDYASITYHNDLQKNIGSNFSESQWRTWFSSYRKIIYHYAELAEENQVELFVVANELMNPAIKRPHDWVETVQRVKDRYKGSVTYAAHIDDFQKITWADQLDILGLDPYYGLSQNPVPTLQELKNAWKPLAANIERVVDRWNKPLIFPEIGYPSAVGAATSPWKYTMIDNPYIKPNVQLQADCVQAIYETFWHQPWFKGVVWWDWHTDPNIGGLDNKHYTPKGKPAADIIAHYNR